MKFIGTLMATSAIGLFCLGAYNGIMYIEGWPPEKCLVVGMSLLVGSTFFYRRTNG